jgi:hypothetical protein
MGHYAYELKEATTFINEENFDEVLVKIIEEVATDKWKGYGWRDSVLNAVSFEDVAREFGIELIDERDGNYRPFINGVYVSSFFKYLIHIVAPYMSDGEMQVDDEYGVTIIVFENGEAQIYKD